MPAGDQRSGPPASRVGTTRTRCVNMIRIVLALCLCLSLHLSFNGARVRAQELDLVVQTGHSATVSTVAFSPDGKLLATAGYDHTIKLWDVETGLQIKEFRPREAVYFQPSSFSRYTSAGTRVINGEQVYVEDTFVNELFLAKTPLSRYLFGQLSARAQELIRKQYGQPTPELLRTLADDLNRIIKGESLYSDEKFKGVRLSPEVQSLIDKKPNGEELVRLNRLLLERAFPEQLGKRLAWLGGYEEIVFSHNSKLIAARAFDEDVQLWAVDASTEISIRQVSPGQMAFSPDDRTLAVIGLFDEVAFFDTASGVLKKRFKHRYDAPHNSARPEAIAFSPDAKTLLSIEQYQQRLPREEGEKEEEGFLLRNWNVESATETPNSIRQFKAVTHGDGVKVQAQCASPDARALVYEVRSKVTDDSGNEKVSYRDALFSVDTGREEKLDEGFRHGDEAWNYDDKKVLCGFSHDGRVLAVAKGNALLIFSAETGAQTNAFSLAFTIDGLGFSDDSSKLALASGSQVSFFDRQSGKVSNVLANHIGGTYARYSRDGSRLILSRGGDDDQVFDLATGKESSNTGELQITSQTLFTSKKWDVSTGLCVTTEERAVEPPQYIPLTVSKRRISPDGRLGVFPYKGRVQVGDLKTNKVIRSLGGHMRDVTDVVFSPDGRVLASGSWDGTIKLWDTFTWKELRTLEGYLSGVPVSISFSSDGRFVAATGQNDTVIVWEVTSGAQKVAIRHSGALTVAFALGGTKLVTGGENGAVKVWDTSNGAELFALKGHTGDVLSLGLNARGDILATGGADKTIKLWDLRNGTELRTLKGHERAVVYVGFSADGELTSESIEQIVEVFDSTVKRKLQTFRGLGEDWHAFLSPDGKTLAVAVPSEDIKFWHAASARPLFEIKWRRQDEHREIDRPDIYDERTLWAFGKDEFAVAFISKKKIKNETESGWQADEAYTFKLWKLGEGGARTSYSKEVVGKLPDHMEFSPGGKWLILTDSSGADLWDTENPGTFFDTGHDSLGASLDVSRDDAQMAAAHGESIELWDLGARKLTGVLRGHASSVTGIEFQPEKNVLMSESADGTFIFWNVAARQELASLIPLDDTDWVVVAPDGRFDASPNAMKLMHYVYGLEVITLEQLKDAYYEPGLLAKLIGSSKEPLRSFRPLRDLKLYPEVVSQEIRPDGTTLSVKLRNRGGGIGPVRIAVNGKTVTEDARDNKLRANPFAETTTLKFDLTGSVFVAGQENRVTVTTSNYDPKTNAGYINSRGATIVYTPKGEKNPEPPRLYAIVGGISDYAGDTLDLRFAAKDAEDFATALRAGAKSLFGADKVDITVLSTTGREGTAWPSKRNFVDAFAGVAKKAKPEDVLVIYLAGHGVSAGIGTDSYYYLTQEAQSASNESLSNPDVRDATAVSSTELTTWLTKMEWVKGEKGLKPLKQVLILDTCAAGSIAGQVSLMTRRDLPGDQIRAIERLKDRTGFHILMGSAADAVSYEATQYGQGLLTYALLQAMRGARLREGEFADVSELFQYAADEVPRLARDIGGIQKPIVAAPLGTSFDIGRFGKDEQSQVPLGRVKPLILRPRLINPEQGFDELELEESLRKSLLELSYREVRTSGGRSADYVFIDADEMPGALRPSGTYVVRGNEVTVRLNLILDGKKVASFQVSGDKTDMSALTYKLTSGVAEAVKVIP